VAATGQISDAIAPRVGRSRWGPINHSRAGQSIRDAILLRVLAHRSQGATGLSGGALPLEYQSRTV